LAERHNGVWGGCWCTWFHRETHSAPDPEAPRTAEATRDVKHQLVDSGHAHAALVFDGERAVGWAQYGSPAELPGINHRKEYLAGVDVLPAYRVTCFFVDRDYRRQGVSEVALRGALALIAQAGGGIVEGYPQDTDGKQVTASFLYNGSRSLFERVGFTYSRPKGKQHCVMAITVPAAG
jgi:GNAT superfamily N-acetyltransferase